MGVKFFGQFLIEQGELDADQLRHALDRMHSHNKTLGEVAVELGLLHESDADAVNLRQRTTDRKFGELAVEMNLLTQPQLDEIVEAQRASKLFIGEAVVDLDFVAADRMPILLDQFKADQAPYQSGHRTLATELNDNAAAQVVLDLLPKFCLRMANVQVKVGDELPRSELLSLGFSVGLSMHGASGLDVILTTDETFGRLLACRVSGISDDALPHELIADGIGEFLNVLCGNALAALDRDGIEIHLDPPRRDCQLDVGTVFELAVGDGRAALILTPL